MLFDGADIVILDEKQQVSYRLSPEAALHHEEYLYTWLNHWGSLSLTPPGEFINFNWFSVFPDVDSLGMVRLQREKELTRVRGEINLPQGGIARLTLSIDAKKALPIETTFEQEEKGYHCIIETKYDYPQTFPPGLLEKPLGWKTESWTKKTVLTLDGQTLQQILQQTLSSPLNLLNPDNLTPGMKKHGLREGTALVIDIFPPLLPPAAWIVTGDR